jgi:hypothetical protein
MSLQTSENIPFPPCPVKEGQIALSTHIHKLQHAFGVARLFLRPVIPFPLAQTRRKAATERPSGGNLPAHVRKFKPRRDAKFGDASACMAEFYNLAMGIPDNIPSYDKRGMFNNLNWRKTVNNYVNKAI